VFTEVLNYTPWIEAQTSAGAKTNYDAALAAREDYHSQGDSGFDPEDTTSNDFGNNGSDGGSVGFGLLTLGSLFVWLRRRQPL
jgi:MYXO-CTERM domain-containing protein